MAKYKIVVSGKQPQANTQNTQLVQQMAQNAANQQLQNQAQAQAEAVDPMRQTVNDLLKTKLLNTVEMPRFTTVQDILDAPKGSKLETFGKFLGNNPDITRLVGTLAGGTYMDRQGNFVNAGEEAARRQEAFMQANQQKALSQMKEQNDIATALNSAFLQSDLAKERNQLQRDLAKEEIEFKKQEAELDRALKREGLNAQIQHQRAMEGLARERLNATGGGGVTGGAANTSNLSPKQIQKNQEMLNSLNAVQSQMDRFANSFGKVRGSKAGALLADAYAKGGFGNQAEANFNAQRTLLFNKIARELGGEKGVLSDQDIKRIEGSLPSLSDSLPQKRAKMKAVYDLLEDRKSQYNIGGNTSSNNDPMGLGL